MHSSLNEIEKEIKMIKGLAKDAGSDGNAFLRSVKNAETLLSKARTAEAKNDAKTREDLVGQIRAMLG